MDLYFQGRSWANKGLTAEHMRRARAFFERALALDPDNIDALVGAAGVDANSGSAFLVDDRTARLAAAEVACIKVLSKAPQHALAHVYLGFAQISTNRVNQGIAECEQALALDHNLAIAHGWIGLAKIFMGRGEETEAHIQEALRLSPRDTNAFLWLHYVGIAKFHLGAEAEAVAWLRRGVEANRNHAIGPLFLATVLARLGKLEDATVAAQAGLALDPSFTIRRFQSSASSDNSTYLAARERMFDGMRLAGVPEG
jgi:tetratricopeptide (TPR) repeat protein